MQLRERIAQAMRKLDAEGLTKGSSGNISVRRSADDSTMLVTPSGVPASQVTGSDIVSVDLDTGKWSCPNAGRKPTSERLMHQELVRMASPRLPRIPSSS